MVSHLQRANTKYIDKHLWLLIRPVKRRTPVLSSVHVKWSHLQREFTVYANVSWSKISFSMIMDYKLMLKCSRHLKLCFKVIIC